MVWPPSVTEVEAPRPWNLRMAKADKRARKNDTTARELIDLILEVIEQRRLLVAEQREREKRKKLRQTAETNRPAVVLTLAQSP